MPQSTNSPQPSPTGLQGSLSGQSRLALYRALVAAFRSSEIATPELDARVLMCAALDIGHEEFVADPDQEISVSERERVMQLARRRYAREPVSRIIGMREFWGLDFEISPDTLDPRPDTETLVRAALEVLEGRSPPCAPVILDIGTGSGCVVLSLLHELGSAAGVGTDTCEGALRVAQANARRHGLDARVGFVRTSWAAGLSCAFDLVVSNPPYIPNDAIGQLAPEVHGFDPRNALDGGNDGLDAYRAIVAGLSRCLRPGGWVIFETGADQAARVGGMLDEGTAVLEFGPVRAWHDLTGHVRCVAARRLPVL